VATARSSLSLFGLRGLFLVILVLGLAGCAWFSARPPGLGGPVSWSALPGWGQDQQAQAWPALLYTCERRTTDPGWAPLCAAATLISAPDDARARRFFEIWFQPYEMRGRGDNGAGLLTGYYTPILQGSLTRTRTFRYPVYGRPADLLVVDLGALYPELKGKVVRGRLVGGRVVPYYSRAQIDRAAPSPSDVIAWVDDPVALFFLQIQGSGRIRLPDGRMIAVGYADQNGHPYVALGRCLVERGGLKPEEVNLDNIRAWLRTHPDQAEDLLHCNPSYVFFTLRDPLLPPLGSLNVPLTPARSIAVDPAYTALGTPVWLDTTLPGDSSAAPYRRLVVAQDTGGAIKGPARADFYFGEGPEAERLAGAMKQPVRMWVLLPRPVSTQSARASADTVH
jgi:membrane-bound lytic murein transglycosylase A